MVCQFIGKTYLPLRTANKCSNRMNMLPSAPRALRPTFFAVFTSAVLAVATASTLVSAGTVNAQTGPSSSTAVVRAIPDRLTQPIQETNRIVLQGTLHPLANKANDRGAVSDGMKLNRMQVVLKRSDAQESTLKQLIGEMHSPGSANYHKWLTPDDFGKQFGPSDADVAKLESWLSSHGFSISKLNPGRQTLEFTGTAGQFRDTFHAAIHSYQVKGETRFANASAPEIPAALAPVFGGFASLNNFRLKSYANVLGKAQFDPATHVSKPEWTIGSASAYNLVLAPGDFNVQYDLKPLYAAGTNGAGQTIAIVNESNINIAQVNNYRSTFGLPANPPQVIIDGNDPGIDGINSPYGPNGASGEAYIDVELAGAVAPNAQIDLVIADDTELQGGLTLAMERAVYGNIAPVISLSFGECELNQGAFNATVNGLWEQAAAQGITVLVSTGDSGSAGCDNDNTQYYAVQGQAVNGLASTPFNVAVGGTDFYYSQYAGTTAALDAQLATYWNLTPTNNTPTVSLLTKIPEQPWNDSQYGLNIYSQYAFNGTTSIAGGGGGASTCGEPTLNSGGSVTACAPYPKPSWQTGTGVPNDSARDLPDVSLFAANGQNNTYYPICAGDGDCEGGTQIQITGVGGTSVSTPAFAGMMALVNQKYGRQGQANYVLYPLARQFPSAFSDVTVGTNSVPCAYSNSNVTPVDCLAVSNPLTVDDPTYGTATEGEIGLTAATPAYNATTGYDLASGLGTIDANNLVTNWGSVVLGATTTTLTPSATTFTHGSKVTVSGTVTGASPTGDVALVTTSPVTSNQGEDFFTLAGGAYTGSLIYLPGGTYDIYGHYAGDGANAASSSTPVSITITPEASTTTLSAYTSLTSNTGAPLAASGGSVTYGSPLTFSAQESGATSGTGSTNPTGNVVFANGSTVLNTAVMNSEGDAEFNAALAPGSYSVTAKYSGDASYNASTSTATSFTVTKETPTITALDFDSSQGDTIVEANGAYFTAFVENTSVYSGLGVVAPSGTLTLTGAPAGTTTSAVLTPGTDPNTGYPAGVAIFKIPAGAAQTNYTFNFAYSGDTKYNTQSASLPETLNSYTGGLVSTTTATTSATSTSPAARVNVSVTVAGTAGGGAPTGSVYLVVGGNSNSFYYSGTNTLVASGATTSTTTIQVDSSSLPQGTAQITVFYVGDNTYYPSSSTLTIANSLHDFSLVPLNPTIVVPNTGTPPGVQTDTINLASYNGFSGAVAVTCAGTGGVTCSLSTPSPTLASDGSASTVLTVNTSAVTAAGTYNVIVTGTDSTGEYIHTIGLQVVTPVIATTAPSFSLAGGTIAIAAPGGMGTSTISATPTNGFTGNIALSCAVTASPAGATGTPTCSLSPTSVSVTGAATSSTLTVDTTTATTAGTYTVTVTGVSGSITQNAAVTVTVTGAVTSAGTFALSSNPTTVTLASQGASGTSIISVTPNATTPYAGAVGLTCQVTASPSGAASLPTCSLSPASVTLGGAAVTSTLTVNTTATTTAGTYTVSVTGAATGVTSQTTPVTVVVNGVAAVGTFSVAGSPASVTLASPGATGTSMISVVPDATTPYAGSVALTCAVTGPTGATALPTCSLTPTSVTLAGATLPSTLTINTSATTTAGTYTVTVSGAGTGTATATTAITVVVDAAVSSGGTFALSSSPASVTVASQGASGTSMISVTPNATTPYAGAVALTCAVTATPTGATEIPSCSLSPASVTLAGAALTSTLTINTTAQTTTRLSYPLKGIFTAGGGVALAALFFFGVPVGRRSRRSLSALKTLRILSVALFFAMIAGAVIGCGSGSSNNQPGTPTGGTTTGTYTVTVTGTPASGTAQTVAVTVTVD